MIIVGTAGHIDHGKTTLSTTLTGVRTDRLKEEVDRGISIELGFAHLDFASGDRCALIDVPGHEKFVRQMIAGAMGIHVVLLVVAADEGIMPQTREHLDICRLLGIQTGAIVLTKVDLVDDEWLELVEEDLREFTSGTFLDGAPIWHFSPHVPSTITKVRTSLEELVATVKAELPPQDATRPFKLSMDRVFSMKGFGTVVTGTVSSGVLGSDDELSSQGGSTMKVRGIQVHGESVQTAGIGNRAAINVIGVEKAELGRGEVLIRGEELEPTSMLDVEMDVVHSLEKPIGKRSKALVHVGTTQLVATVILLGKEEVLGGEKVFAQLRLEKPTIALAGERFVLRGFEVLANYGKTFAGGRILDPHPMKHKSNDAAVVQSLEQMAGENPATVLAELVRSGGEMEVTTQTLWRRSTLGLKTLQSSLIQLEKDGIVDSIGGNQRAWLHCDGIARLHTKTLDALRVYHESYPARVGMPREELRSRLRYGLEADVMDSVLSPLLAEKTIRLEGDSFCLATFTPRIDGALGEILKKMEDQYTTAGLEPPLATECAEGLGMSQTDFREAMDVLVRNGALVHVKGPLYFAASAIADLQAQLIAFLKNQPEITTLEFKDLAGVSRKFAIPLAEYFDAQKITVRSGNAARKLRPGLG